MLLDYELPPELLLELGLGDGVGIVLELELLFINNSLILAIVIGPASPSSSRLFFC